MSSQTRGYLADIEQQGAEQRLLTKHEPHVEEAEEIRGKKGLHGLKLLSALRGHLFACPSSTLLTNSFGTRRGGQYGQG